MGKKQAHLELIQGVVNRLATNSFLLKGWSVVLVSALFALAAGSDKVIFAYIACFPAIAFWILDGYFLWQERLFRALFDHVRGLEDTGIDFSMDTSIVKKRVSTWRNVVFSMTLMLFHGTVVASIFVIVLVLALS
jgi:hypothetical protein